LSGWGGIMVEELLTSESQDEWDAFVRREPTFALMQSWEWGEIKKRLGWEAFRLAIREKSTIIAAAQMLVKHLPLGNGSIAYIPRGPIGKWTDPDIYEQLFTKVHQIGLSQHAIFLKVEPSLLKNAAAINLLNQNDFRYTTFTNQPRATIVMDLTQDLDTIFGQMRKSTRRKIKDGPRKGLTVRIGSEADLPIFYELMKVTGERAGFTPRSYKYYQTEYQSLASLGNSFMMLVYYEDKPLAAHISYTFGGHAAFFHQVSSNDKGNLNPNYLLVWEKIKLLKEKGCRTYDLWGIPDEIGDLITQEGDLPKHDRHDGLWGVYRFKVGFDKNVVVYPGAYDYVYQSIPYTTISPVISRENFFEPVLRVVSLRGFENTTPGLSYLSKELRFIKSYKDLEILLRKTSYTLFTSVNLLNKYHKNPLGLQIEPTNCCNAACAFCPGRRSTRKNGYIDMDLFKRIVDEAAMLGVKRIYLDLHGEPTLHPRIIEMIQYVKSKNLAFHMTTNGMLLDQENSREILRAGVTRADHITFSILGDSKNTHNSLMKHANLEIIKENICALVDARKQLGLNGPVIDTIFRKIDQNRYEEEGYRDTWNGIVDYAKSGGSISKSFSTYKLGTPSIARKQRCKTVQERMTIYWNGAVTICPHDLDGDYVLGNLNEQSIQEIWNGEQLSTLRKLHREKRFAEFPLCERCDF